MSAREIINKAIRERTESKDEGIPLDRIIPDGTTQAKLLENAGLHEQAAAVREEVKRQAQFDLSDTKDGQANTETNVDYIMEGARKYAEVYKYLRGELGLVGEELREATHFVLHIDWRYR